MKPISLQEILQEYQRQGWEDPDTFREKQQFSAYFTWLAHKKSWSARDHFEAATRRVGHTTMLIAEALCEIRRGRKVLITAANSEIANHIVRKIKELVEASGLPPGLVEKYNSNRARRSPNEVVLTDLIFYLKES